MFELFKQSVMPKMFLFASVEGWEKIARGLREPPRARPYQLPLLMGLITQKDSLS